MKKISTRVARILGLLFVSYSILCCQRAVFKDGDPALRVSRFKSFDFEDMKRPSFLTALEDVLVRCQSRSSGFLQLGKKRVSASDYCSKISLLKEKLNTSAIPDFQNFFFENFEVLESYGNKDWGEVFATSYYQPLIDVRIKRDKEFSEAILKTPSDLVEIDWSSFASLLNMPLDKQKLRGKLIYNETRKIIVPSPKRELVSNEAFDQNILAFGRPIDVFFLQIQGSGRLKFLDKKVTQVTYANQNGHPYFAIGKLFKEKITKLSAETLKLELEKLSSEELKEVLNKNSSFVYFREAENAQTAYGIPPRAERTLAVDPRYIPLGSLAWIELIQPEEKNEFKRWAFATDTGGAIKGPARVDFYMGEGSEAGYKAGLIQHSAKLYIIAPK